MRAAAATLPPQAPAAPADSGLLFLDGLRGLAAFYVMVGHARWLLWEGYSEGFLRHPEAYTPAHKGLVYFFSLFKYGHEAVMFFFVLSGFVIHLRYARQLAVAGAGARFDWGGFVRRRARRLYPPLLAAMLLALAVTGAGRALGWPIFGEATPCGTINRNVVLDTSAGTALGNLAFLMDTYVPAFGGNGPLWSLKFEWWFYMLYPVFWWLTRRSLWLATGVLAALFLATPFPDLWPLRLARDVFGGMIVWWLGVLVADVHAGRIRLPWATLAVAAMAVGAGLALVWPERGRQAGFGLVFSGLIGGCFHLLQRGWKLRALARLKPLGDMSYTLYVTHFPLLIFLSGWLMARSPERLLPRGFGWVLAGMALTLVLAYALHFVVERPFLSRARRRSSA